MGEVKVVLFGAAADRAGTRATEVPVGGRATLSEVWEALAGLHPGLSPLKGTLAFAVNGEYAGMDAPVRAGDEVAVLPPVSGGER